MGGSRSGSRDLRGSVRGGWGSVARPQQLEKYCHCNLIQQNYHSQTYTLLPNRRSRGARGSQREINRVLGNERNNSISLVGHDWVCGCTFTGCINLVMLILDFGCSAAVYQQCAQNPIKPQKMSDVGPCDKKKKKKSYQAGIQGL